jgi:hypothetical protein
LSAIPAGGRHHPAHAERGANRFGLAGAGGAGANNFLERDDVGVNRAEHGGNAIRPCPSIHALAAMDVVT